ncbi:MULTISPECIES: DMT family transporter [Rhizobium]|uniref:Permease n=1 Tax=Rhizobium favelukesii TaxID=348824 RepID=W6RRW0_9HYPH|nr:MULTISPECIES: DMT family transporter [Rhizobium]MCA0804780.1 DMT family transporter [Rhizobium sp. T1473]MCS0458379.1 DMT family transporter [Rhizobium favelukesii]UFS79837.1 DMT family transporter [Rhizobium sp. T136]CDM61548.1 putative permease [Rhizobium favelukesii]
MLSPSHDHAPSPLVGIALACSGYSLFAIQDAVVKWLVADYAVPQILFMRSIMIVIVAGIMVRRLRHPSILKSPHRKSLLVRAGLMLAAWMAYYSAARDLGLAEITTMYFSAPIMVVMLSILVLKESVGPMRWLACIGGFAGVVLAANPAEAPSLVPAGMVIFAGFCWAWSTVLVRLVSRTESTLNQMMATSFLFVVACGVMLPWLWKTPDLFGWILMIGLGFVAAAGQYLLYEGFRYAPASTLAPMEYSGLVWAFLYGYLIWSDVPTPHVVAGAALIVASSLTLVWWERRQMLLTRRLTA